MAFDDLIGTSAEDRAHKRYDNRKEMLEKFVDKWGDDPQLLADKLLGAIDCALLDLLDTELLTIELAKRYNHVVGDTDYTDRLLEKFGDETD